MISLRKRLAVVGMAIVSSLAATSVAQAESVNAGGASFPANYLKAAQAEFNKVTGHNVNYGSTAGSSSGQSGFKDGTFDMGGTDSAVSSSRIPSFGWTYVPYLAGAIGITYRLDELKGAQLSLSPGTAEAIFNGSISNWNDPRIANDMRQNPTWRNLVRRSSVKGASAQWQNSRTAGTAVVTVALTPAAVKANRGKRVEVINQTTKRTVARKSVGSKSEISLTVRTDAKAKHEVRVNGKRVATYQRVKTPALPNKPIVVVYRDGSGTTANFSNYMKSLNARWNTSNDFSTNVPGGVSSFGSRFQKQGDSAALANYVANTNASIGYVETSFAFDAGRQSKGVRVASLQNNYGEFVAPSAAAYNAFLGAQTVEANGFVNMNYSVRKRGAYPIGAVTYMLAKTAKSAKSDVVREFLEWSMKVYAPKFAEGLGYVPLSGIMRTKALAMAAKVSAS